MDVPEDGEEMGGNVYLAAKSICHELVVGHRLRAGLGRSERAEARGSGSNIVNVGLKGRRLS